MNLQDPSNTIWKKDLVEVCTPAVTRNMRWISCLSLQQCGPIFVCSYQIRPWILCTITMRHDDLHTKYIVVYLAIITYKSITCVNDITTCKRNICGFINFKFLINTLEIMFYDKNYTISPYWLICSQIMITDNKNSSRNC